MSNYIPSDTLEGKVIGAVIGQFIPQNPLPTGSDSLLQPSPFNPQNRIPYPLLPTQQPNQPPLFPFPFQPKEQSDHHPPMMG
jgi:hypothetical protein